MTLRKAVALLLEAEGKRPEWQFDRVFGSLTATVRDSAGFVSALKVVRSTVKRTAKKSRHDPK